MTTDNSRSSGGAGTGLADGHPRPATRVGDAETQAAPAGTRTTAPGLRGLVARLPVRGARRATVVTVLAAVVGAVVLGGAAFGYSAAKRATYTSESLVIVLSDGGGSGDVGPITAAWVKIGEAPLVLEGAAQQVGVDARQVQTALAVSQPESTPLVSIRATTPDPRRSAAWANAVADQMLAQATVRPIPGYSLKQLTVAVPAERADAGLGASLILGVAVLGALGGGVLGRRGLGRSA